MAAANTALKERKSSKSKSTTDVKLDPAAAAKVAAPPPEPPTVVLQSVRSPLKAVGPNISAGARTVMRHVGGLTVMNVTARNQLNLAEQEVLDDILYELRGMERPLMRVESFSEFFDARVQFERMASATAAQNRVTAASVGLELSDAELASLENYRAVKKKIQDFFRAAGPQYTFAKQQRGESKLTITATHVSNGRYEVTLKQAENIWKRARKVWGDENPSKTAVAGGTVSPGYNGSQTISIRADEVSIGCQTLTRWQVEQVAIQMGWADG